MIEIICLIITFLGLILASAYDLKTTEIPDWIPHAMILSGLFLNTLNSFISFDFSKILNSLILGLSFLGFGFLMYYTGQWGGGDAKILAATGFLFPSLPTPSKKLILPFPLSYLFNLFFIGAAYMLLYAFILSLIKRKILIKFFEDVKANSKFFALASILLLITFIFISFVVSLFLNIEFELLRSIQSSLLPLIFSLSVFILWKFAKSVEEFGFKKRIPVSMLKVGDVLEDSKLWEGLTKKEVEKIKRSGKKYVVIKEGVRFAPAFPLALLFTLYYGDFLFIFLRLI